MKTVKSLFIAVVGFGLFAVTTTAGASGLVLEGGLHFGGDELVSATYTDGSSASIDAGALFSFGIGVGFDLSPNVESRVTIGIKVDEITASNGDISFTRYPIDVLLLLNTGDWKLGGGLTYHLNPKLDGGGVVSGLRAEFDDALGLLLEIDRNLGNFYIGGRITFINYDSIASTGVRRTTINGDSFGIVAGMQF